MIFAEPGAWFATAEAILIASLTSFSVHHVWKKSKVLLVIAAFLFALAAGATVYAITLM